MAEHFLGESTETRGGAVSNKQKMENLLRTLGDPGFQVSVGAVGGVHQTTVSKTLKGVMSKVLENMDNWIRFPATDNEIDAAVLKWSQKMHFPHVFGAIDCTHVRIKKPHANGDEYCNRKGYTSINVQTTCNSSEQFTSVDATWPGSVHDSRIWKNSNIFAIVAGNSRHVALLGDEGYGLMPWMIHIYHIGNLPTLLLNIIIRYTPKIV